MGPINRKLFDDCEPVHNNPPSESLVSYFSIQLKERRGANPELRQTAETCQASGTLGIRNGARKLDNLSLLNRKPLNGSSFEDVYRRMRISAVLSEQ